MKGVILAGGTGSRLFPVTKVVSKQLLNVFDKPMIYYPLSTLMLSGIREICIITSPNDATQFKNLLGSGSKFGLRIDYVIQEQPEGLPQALILSERFLDNSSCALILGDNLFYGPTLGFDLQKYTQIDGCQIFGYHVSDPERYGVVEIDAKGQIIGLEEKPVNPASTIAIPGLYYFDQNATTLALSLKKSPRGEYEMIDLLKLYQDQNKLKLTVLPRGTAWLDTGTPESLHDASSYIKAIQERQGLLISSPEEIAYRNGWINSDQFELMIAELGSSQYAKSLKKSFT